MSNVGSPLSVLTNLVGLNAVALVMVRVAEHARRAQYSREIATPGHRRAPRGKTRSPGTILTPFHQFARGPMEKESQGCPILRSSFLRISRRLNQIIIASKSIFW